MDRQLKTTVGLAAITFWSAQQKKVSVDQRLKTNGTDKGEGSGVGGIERGVGWDWGPKTKNDKSQRLNMMHLHERALLYGPACMALFGSVDRYLFTL